jgi:hypothetical protein
LPGYFDRPHNHRWSYASTVIAGRYRHILFGDADLDERIDPASLTPVMVRREQAGNRQRMPPRSGCRSSGWLS